MENVSTSFAIKTIWDCYDAGGEWVNPQANFDNTHNAMTTLFTAVTTEGWVHLMWSGVDAVGLNMEPQRDTNPHMVPYFIVFMSICSIIMHNLYVGVVIDTNTKEKDKVMNNNQLTPLQIEYSDTLTKCYQAYPTALYTNNDNKCLQ